MAAATADPQAAATGPASQSGSGASGAASQSAAPPSAHARRATALTRPARRSPPLRAADQPDGAVDGGVRRDAVEVDLGHREAQRVQRRRAAGASGGSGRAARRCARGGGASPAASACARARSDGREARRAARRRLGLVGEAQRPSRARPRGAPPPPGGRRGPAPLMTGVTGRCARRAGSRSAARPRRPQAPASRPAIASSARMRFSTFGWVEKRLSIRCAAAAG